MWQLWRFIQVHRESIPIHTYLSKHLEARRGVEAALHMVNSGFRFGVKVPSKLKFGVVRNCSIPD